MRSMIIAAVIALSATVATAQDAKMMEEMAGGLTMVENSTKNILMQFGLEADVMSLTMGQIAEINGVLTGSNSEADKKAGIEAALRK